jgi:hypothetical protein
MPTSLNSADKSFLGWIEDQQFNMALFNMVNQTIITPIAKKKNPLAI